MQKQKIAEPDYFKDEDTDKLPFSFAMLQLKFRDDLSLFSDNFT